MDRFITTKEAAATVGVSTRMIQKLVSGGDLVATRIGRALRISEASLDEYIQRNTVIPNTKAVPQRLAYRTGQKLV